MSGLKELGLPSPASAINRVISDKIKHAKNTTRPCEGHKSAILRAVTLTMHFVLIYCRLLVWSLKVRSTMFCTGLARKSGGFKLLKGLEHLVCISVDDQQGYTTGIKQQPPWKSIAHTVQENNALAATQIIARLLLHVNRLCKFECRTFERRPPAP
jgi:hypothetical protein